MKFMNKLMELNLKSGSKVTINGQTFTGNNVVISDGKITVDGVITQECDQQNITVRVEGDVESVQTSSGDIYVKGSVREVSTMSGDVICENVDGSVRTVSGDVTCGNVAVSVKTGSGDIYRI